MSEIIKTPLPGVLIINPKRFEDDRGFFSESFSQQEMSAALGYEIRFVQDNHSFSRQRGTVRGLHFQAPPFAQDKLVRCGRGALLDVSVDLRKGSPTYGQWTSVELSFDNGRQVFVPAGFGHGFVTLTPDTEIVYKCSDYYAPQAQGAVFWADKALNIDWGIGPEKATLSEKDAGAASFADFDSPFVWAAQ